MTTYDDHVRLAPDDQEDAALAARPLGRVIAVTGSRVTVQFAANRATDGIDDAEITVGSLLGIDTGSSLAIGALSEIFLEPAAAGGSGDRTIGHLDLLGEITDEAGEPRFSHGVTIYPKLGSAIVAAGRGELEVVFALNNPHTVEIGRLQQDPTIPAHIDVDELVQKHFAIVGSTGAGKSTALALILRKIMQTRADLSILLVDAHNEYGASFEDRAQVLGPGDLKLPFWLLSFDEIAQIIFGSGARPEREVGLLAELIPAAKTEYARNKSALRASYRPAQRETGRYTADTPVPYRIEDVVAVAEGRMGKLENGDLAVQYQRLLTRIDNVRRNPRYGFMFDAADGSDSMVEILSQLLRLDHEERPMAIVQLAGFPAETIEVIVAALFRLAFEFGVWSDALSPLLIVCEEAHNYANADRDIGFRPAREGLSRIAKEGRKHGVFLGLVTQRPHQLDATLISQCSTVFAMRLGHKDDQDIVRAAVSGAASRLLSFLPSLGTREAVVIGAGVSSVMRLRFEELAADRIPRSQVIWGADLDGGRIDEELIGAVVARWRGGALNVRAAAAQTAGLKLHSDDIMRWSAPPARA